MAIVELIMPKMGESIMEATILRWHKKVGDTVLQDETVLDIATDKVDSEVPSTASGVIKEIRYNVNDVVPIGSIIATIETDASNFSQTNTLPTPVVAEQPIQTQTVLPEPVFVTPQPVATPTVSIPTPIVEVPFTPQPVNVSPSKQMNNRFYSPLVLNIANSEGLGMAELELIPGTGAEGRVSKKDILQYIADKKAGKVAAYIPQQPVYQPVKVAAPVYQAPPVQPVEVAAPVYQAPPVQPVAPVFVPPIVEPVVAQKVAPVEHTIIKEPLPTMPPANNMVAKIEEPAPTPIIVEPVKAITIEQPQVTMPALTPAVFETATTSTITPVTETITPTVVAVAEQPKKETIVEDTPVLASNLQQPIVAAPAPVAATQVVVPVQQPSLATAIPLVTLAEGDKGKFVQPHAAVPTGNVEIIEMDRMRKLIAKHMVDSKHTSPHVTSFAEADVTNMVLWRDRVKNDFERREGTKLTFTPMFVDCLVKVMKQFPMVNASVDGDKIIIRKDFNIGMATALPSGNLIVPVIKAADKLNIVGLSNAVNNLANAARNNQLKPDDTSGGTFTLTNVGTFGSLMGTPIINQPQVAILAVGAIKKRPMVIETADGDTIGIRHIMYLSLSYDHRIVDGSIGASFLTAVAKEFEAWDINRTWYQYL